jgi:hypothetical protein
MSNFEIVIVILFFILLIGSGIYIFFKDKKYKCNKLNIFGKKATNTSYQNWDGRLDDMPELII